MFIQLWVWQAVGTNHHQCSSIFTITIQGNVTGVISKAITPKDKERYFKLLYKTKCMQRLYVGSSHLKTKKEKSKPPYKEIWGKKNLMWFIEVLDEVLFTLFSSALKNCNEALILN